MQDTPEGEVTIDQRLHLGTGFLAPERDWVVEHLVALGSRLRSFRDDQVDLEISLKDRDGAEQRVTLECWINRTPRLHLVATSSERDLSAALNEVRTELVRQVDEAKTRTEPRNNRALRSVPTLPELG
ncbi:HPF/RaiA family ribosome-associated protein [Saccharothrix longispora]|uniref:Ribosome-associated translation inhibitor RaiA n=1 Tax=Saccharothrix longispora TaxID=33920 RepID=A0ABU1PUH4_9PSEU|nr:HPF/RaiA family ribosome-associated protein [Saccharothrix longispora]MDR6594274.1 ribosome-associated translation inhibitor RaiA [Saccharothrix longispora]